MKGIRYQCKECESTLNALWLKVRRGSDERWIRAPYYYCINCQKIFIIDDVADTDDIYRIKDVIKRYKTDKVK
jgi:hypothetical protein